MKKLITAVLMIVLTTAWVRSEFFLDAYGGLAVPSGGSFSVSTEQGSDGGDFSDSGNPAIGLRGGYWLKELNMLGAALDFSSFSADSEFGGSEVEFSYFSLMLMLRYPLMIDAEFPNGRLMPYAGAGPSLVFAEVDSSYVNTPDSEDLDDDDGSGFVFCAGTRWFFNPNFGFFIEYRYVTLSFDQSADWQTWGGLLGPYYNHSYEADGDVRAHQFMSGITFHF